MKEFLFRVARSDISGQFIGYAFENLTWIMPVDRVIDTPKTIIFDHPVSQWEYHLLAVPKKAIKSFMSLDLGDTNHQEHIQDLFESIQKAAKKEGYQRYAILLNGGEYQDVSQIHVHVISGSNKSGTKPAYLEYYKSKEGKIVEEDNNIKTVRSKNPMREIQLVSVANNLKGTIQEINLRDRESLSTFLSILQRTQELVRHFNLQKYTLLSVHQPEELGNQFTLYLISGDSLLYQSL